MISGMPHVVHIIDELPPDGAERLLADMLRHRSKAFRFSVVCLIRGGSLAPEIEALGVPVVVLGRSSRRDPSLLFRLAAWLGREHADVVHTHLFTADTYGRVAARMAGVPAVFSTAHNTVICQGALRRSLHWALSWLSTRVVACSEEVGRVLLEQDHLPKRRVEVIANGIDIDRLLGASGEGVRAEFEIPSGTPLIGVVGRLHPAKGHADLISAMAALREQSLDVRCLIIGSGETRPELERRAKELGLESQLSFVGQRQDVPRLLAALDVLVVPSRWEGLPLVLLEGMALAKPIVATRVSGIPEVIRDGENGLLVPPAEPPALATALRRLLSEPALRTTLGDNARATLRERYDVVRTARAYEALYAKALGVPEPFAEQNA